MAFRDNSTLTTPHARPAQSGRALEAAPGSAARVATETDRRPLDRKAVAEPRDDRRRDPRYLITRPVLAVPVLPNGLPDERHVFEGFSINLSAGGILWESRLSDPPSSQRLVVGLDVADGAWRFATVEIRRADPIAGGLRVAACCAAPGRDIFRPRNLLPAIDPETQQFTTGLPEETLQSWARLGILRPEIVDYVLVCPECKAVPTFRYGCAACGSLRVSQVKLIHHYACAHVGELSEFQNKDELSCPKCHSPALVVSRDFEHLPGPYRCQDCSAVDHELAAVGRCRKCELLFPLSQCPEIALVGYHVERLDPLALIGAS